MTNRGFLSDALLHASGDVGKSTTDNASAKIDVLRRILIPDAEGAIQKKAGEGRQLNDQDNEELTRSARLKVLADVEQDHRQRAEIIMTDRNKVHRPDRIKTIFDDATLIRNRLREIRRGFEQIIPILPAGMQKALQTELQHLSQERKAIQKKPESATRALEGRKKLSFISPTQTREERDEYEKQFANETVGALLTVLDKYQTLAFRCVEESKNVHPEIPLQGSSSDALGLGAAPSSFFAPDNPYLQVSGQDISGSSSRRSIRRRSNSAAGDVSEVSGDENYEGDRNPYQPFKIGKTSGGPRRIIP